MKTQKTATRKKTEPGSTIELFTFFGKHRLCVSFFGEARLLVEAQCVLFFFPFRGNTTVLLYFALLGKHNFSRKRNQKARLCFHEKHRFAEASLCFTTMLLPFSGSTGYAFSRSRSWKYGCALAQTQALLFRFRGNKCRKKTAS